VVGRDYQMTQIVTVDGRVLSGIVVAETPTAITMQTPNERIVVPLEDIEARHLSEKSLMPENQLAQLDASSARDLIAYLQHPTQVPLSFHAADKPVESGQSATGVREPTDGQRPR
jgi:putative heme-binding domain-containing protein